MSSGAAALGGGAASSSSRFVNVELGFPSRKEGPGTSKGQSNEVLLGRAAAPQTRKQQAKAAAADSPSSSSGDLSRVRKARLACYHSDRGMRIP
jgi:hypothetical protein